MPGAEAGLTEEECEGSSCIFHCGNSSRAAYVSALIGGVHIRLTYSSRLQLDVKTRWQAGSLATMSLRRGLRTTTDIFKAKKIDCFDNFLYKSASCPAVSDHAGQAQISLIPGVGKESCLRLLMEKISHKQNNLRVNDSRLYDCFNVFGCRLGGK